MCEINFINWNFTEFMNFAIFIIFGIWISIQDFKNYKIPLEAVYVGFFIIFINSLIFEKNLIFIKIGGILYCFSVFIMTRKISKNKLGIGDIHFSIFCGIFLGFYKSIIFMFLLIINFMIFYKFFSYFINIKNHEIYKNSKKYKNQPMPFGPIMFFSAVLSSFINL